MKASYLKKYGAIFLAKRKNMSYNSIKREDPQAIEKPNKKLGLSSKKWTGNVKGIANELTAKVSLDLISVSQPRDA